MAGKTHAALLQPEDAVDRMAAAWVDLVVFVLVVDVIGNEAQLLPPLPRQGRAPPRPPSYAASD